MHEQLIRDIRKLLNRTMTKEERLQLIDAQEEWAKIAANYEYKGDILNANRAYYELIKLVALYIADYEKSEEEKQKK